MNTDMVLSVVDRISIIIILVLILILKIIKNISSSKHKKKMISLKEQKILQSNELTPRILRNEPTQWQDHNFA